MRVLFGLPLFLIDSDELLSLACVFAKAVVGNSIKPGGKLCFAAEAADVFVSANKRILREIIGKGDVAARELPQQTAHARLMATDQLAISVLVLIDNDPSDKCGIG